MDDDETAAADRKAQLDRAWIDGAPRHDRTIRLVAYDDAWPASYEREAARIRSILRERVVQLEHVGSTSVPGLSAKPQIDILLVVPDTANEDAYVPDMVAAGYRLTIREPDWYEHRLFKGPDTNINLHTFSPGAAEIDRMLAFRDRLRTHPEERAQYEATKRELAARTWAYVQDYADAKGQVVEEIIARALGEPGLPA
ncbi:MAG TPA: GrpB family protein [Candidatus Limnocylindrales bacterium]|nr:GrpB family protein [Candidatus Limnocylindrales bacterium]